MKALTVALVLALLLVAAVGCGEKATTTTQGETPATTAETDSAQPATTTANANVWTGEIVETMNSGGYTYVLLDTGAEKIWAAAPETTAEVGQKVSVTKGMMMANFSSKTLDRVFEEIYFVGAIEPADGHTHGPSDDPKATMPTGMGGTSQSANTAVADAAVEGVAKAAGGYTVAEIFAESANLGGQKVKVRGRVVKFTAKIMGTNWIHIQDGTQGDLTVTTDAVVATGDLVLVEGVLAVNKDFGAGYRYDAIIEQAAVTKE